MSALTELEVVTERHFMPVITNQIFQKSPLLYRIFRIAEEGNFGMAKLSYDGRSIVEPIEVAETVTATTEVGAYAKTDTWTAGDDEVLKGANYDFKMGLRRVRYVLFKFILMRGRLRLLTPANLFLFI